MIMDVTCEAESMATTRDCKAHLVMREKEDNPRLMTEMPPAKKHLVKLEDIWK